MQDIVSRYPKRWRPVAPREPVPFKLLQKRDQSRVRSARYRQRKRREAELLQPPQQLVIAQQPRGEQETPEGTPWRQDILENLAAMTTASPSNEAVNLDTYPNARKLVDRCKELFAQIEHLTPGSHTEAYLNAHYGPGHPLYEDIANLIRSGIRNEEGWCATIPVDGRKYRRSKVALPSEDTKFFSITTVYMDSHEPYRGQYHQHPYGEINCVIQLDETAELMGMQGWQGAGWTSPGPGTHHYPEVRGGAVVALFFLPCGRISYEAKPGMPQPNSL